MKKKLFDSPVLFGLLGPIFILLTASLTFFGPTHNGSFILWLIFSFLLSFFITGYHLADLTFDRKEIKEQEAEKEKQLKALQIKMQQMQTQMVKEKASLDEVVQRLQEKQKLEISQVYSLKEEEFQELRFAYQKVFEEATSHKNRSSSLQASLEEALVELGQLRQKQYLYNELKEMAAQVKTQPSVQVVHQEPQTPKVLIESFEEPVELLLEEQTLLNHFGSLAKEYQELEEEVLLLEEILSSSLQSKKSKVKAKGEESQQTEESLQLDF